MQVQNIDEADMYVIVNELDVDFYANENHFFAFQFSPFLDIDMLWSVKRIYRMDHWFFWSPVDLLDRRYYIPFVTELKFYDDVFYEDFFVKNDSIFYKKRFLFSEEAFFNKNNFFFFDKERYDYLNLDFINYQIFPNLGSIDFFKNNLYGRDYTSFKPKMMSFKIFLSNHLLIFEKFYLKNKLYLADDFQYYFDEDFLKKNSIKQFNLFDEAYFGSLLQFSESYMDGLKTENYQKTDNLKETTDKNFFEYPFTNYNYYSGNNLPYMFDYLF